MTIAEHTNFPKRSISGAIGNLETRLASSHVEIHQSQKLRYDVFYREMAAKPGISNRISRRDSDQFDYHCDHLLVVETGCSTHPNSENIVGSYRLLRQEKTKHTNGFYSENEFAVSALLAKHNKLNFLELGRSCVLPEFRNKRTIELLWHGTWSYVLQHKLDVLFGCASFSTTNPDEIAEPLSLLHHHYRTEGVWAINALADKKVDMNRIGIEEINPRAALRKLPPLIKGYLRLGAKIGDGAVIDYQFGTIDVMIILPVSHINPRYISHYGAQAQRFRK